jgi:hypothetical protein
VPHRIAIAYGTLQSKNAAPHRRDGGLHFLGSLLLLVVVESDISSFAGARQAHCPPNTPRSTGDESYTPD